MYPVQSVTYLSGLYQGQAAVERAAALPILILSSAGLRPAYRKPVLSLSKGTAAGSSGRVPSIRAAPG